MASSPLSSPVVTKRGVKVTLNLVPPEEVISHAGRLELVYCSAFGSAPWFESARQARRFILRLLDHTASSGFRLVIAEIDQQLVGFAYGRIALSRSEELEERYLPLVEWLGPVVSQSVLFETFELTEFAVATSWQGQGIGALVHDYLLTEAPCNKAWLITHALAENAQALYRSRGWRATANAGPAEEGARRTLMSISTGVGRS